MPQSCGAGHNDTDCAHTRIVSVRKWHVDTVESFYELQSSLVCGGDTRIPVGHLSGVITGSYSAVKWPPSTKTPSLRRTAMPPGAHSSPTPVCLVCDAADDGC